MGLYLGLDSSTQSLSALCLDAERGRVEYETSVNFGDDLPEYESPNGFLENDDPLVRHANPLMWLAALDLLLEKMSKDGFDLSSIDMVSGSGQQHGSVYLNSGFLKPESWSGGSLKEIFAPLLSRNTSPIWMDSSTSAECAEIAEKIGGGDAVLEKTGSIMVERFTGPQIRKFFKGDEDAYGRTAAIHLVSSFMASALAWRSVPIDLADGAGMNLLNLRAAEWDDDMLAATAPGLRGKLPPTASSDTATGTIGQYFVEKHGFKPECRTMVWSGDNPNSLVGMGASDSGTAVISLGTSDTFMAAFESPASDPNGFGHAFFNPDKGYMCLICFKNGSLAREKVRDEFSLDWNGFERLLATEKGDDGETNLLIPFHLPEITPKTSAPFVRRVGAPDFESGENPEKTVRAIVDTQTLNMKIHSAWIGALDKIKITGGASRSDAICQTVADVFQTSVERFAVPNSAALGAALRAANADLGTPLSELHRRTAASEQNTIFAPDAGTVPRYERMEGKLRDILDTLK